jgi:Sec-independent protein translocase protein TatA
MPERFQSNINLPIAIPAWGLITLIGTVIFGAGAMYNKLDQMATSLTESRQQLTSQMTAIATMQFQAQNHEARIANLERAILERKTQ